MAYAIGFILVWAFFTFVYGDILHRAEQDIYISPYEESFSYILTQPFGHLYYLARWPMLLCKWPWLGGLLLSLIMTIAAVALDYALCLPKKLSGIGYVVPAATIGWMIWRGSNIYYKNEPSLILLIPFAAMAAALVLALIVGIVKLIVRKRQQAEAAIVPAKVRPWGVLMPIVLMGGLTWASYQFNYYAMVTARLQNMCSEEDWEGIIDEVRKVKRPSRAVAAFYAIALEETDQLLNGLFDIPFDYPKLRFDSFDGSEEYGLFLVDCSLHSGLLNTAYRCGMDHVVVNGPRLYIYKRMAIAALLNKDYPLAKKYLALIEKMPFESDFVEKYRPMVDNPSLTEKDPTLAHILSLYPRSDKFEQNFQPPAFLGYNVRLSSGSDNTLLTSAAACMYSKDLKAFLQRAVIMHQKGMSFPNSVQQAIAILSLQQPELLQQFPEVGRFVPDEIRSFLLDAKPYVKDRIALRRELKERWLGTFVYYYYTENNDPNQVVKSYDSSQSVGVN